MLWFSHWKQMGGGDTRLLHFQHLSFLLLCGGLTNSLRLKIERISDSSLKWSFDVEKTLYIETRKSDLAPLMQFSPVPFHSTKDTKKRETLYQPFILLSLKTFNVPPPIWRGLFVPCSWATASHSLLSSAAGSHWVPQSSSCLKSYIGHCTKFVIQAESTETQVPNTERALFILKKCSTTLAN